MAKVKTYNLEGAETGSIDLDDKVFNDTAKPELMYQVIRVMKINQRQSLAHVKDRSEVRGGGKKPWRQKGTGRARHGSSRSPIWKGGGVTFGPRKENITKLSIPKKMAKKALRAAVSQRVQNANFFVVEGNDFEKPATKKAAEFLKALKLGAKKVLFLSDAGAENIIRSFANLPKTKSTRIGNLNILDLLSYSAVIVNKNSIEKLTKQLS